MTTGTVFYANQFNFFINKNDDYQKSFTGKPYNISLAPTKNYVCPNANEFELKALADFIYGFIGEEKGWVHSRPIVGIDENGQPIIIDSWGESNE
jgi:hypothetical protein